MYRMNAEPWHTVKTLNKPIPKIDDVLRVHTIIVPPPPLDSSIVTPPCAFTRHTYTYDPHTTDTRVRARRNLIARGDDPATSCVLLIIDRKPPGMMSASIKMDAERGNPWGAAWRCGDAEEADDGTPNNFSVRNSSHHRIKGDRPLDVHYYLWGGEGDSPIRRLLARRSWMEARIESEWYILAGRDTTHHWQEGYLSLCECRLSGTYIRPDLQVVVVCTILFLGFEPCP